MNELFMGLDVGDPLLENRTVIRISYFVNGTNRTEVLHLPSGFRKLNWHRVNANLLVRDAWMDKLAVGLRDAGVPGLDSYVIYYYNRSLKEFLHMAAWSMPYGGMWS